MLPRFLPLLPIPAYTELAAAVRRRGDRAGSRRAGRHVDHAARAGLDLAAIATLGHLVGAAAVAEQDEELDAIADRARTMDGPLVILGDFNATPWSRPFRRVRARTGLCDSRAGFEASFPAASEIVRIPIDHLLASCSIGVRDRYIERDVGSDHLPVILDPIVPRPRG
jgi:endonuclease/exonuclease/phosphatase (EEP) superfamily protein YafD